MNSSRTSALERPSVVLLTVDALRADRLGCYGYSRPTSPAIDRFAQSAIRCDLACSHASFTPDSFPALLGSICPLAVDAQPGVRVRAFPSHVRSLPECFRAAGYRTAAIHSNPYLSRAFGYQRGFDNFDDALYLSTTKLVVHAWRVANLFKRRPYLPAATVNRRALAWIERLPQDQPFFLWLHYMDVHGPYQPPAHAMQAIAAPPCPLGDRQMTALWRRAKWHPGTVNAESRTLLSNLYDAEIRNLDAHLGRLIEELEGRHSSSPVVVALTADHGEAFGEHGRFDHPRDTYEELIRVPLLLRLPGGLHAGTVWRSPVPAIDVAPTLLDASGLPPEPDHHGKSLLPAVNGTEAPRSHAIGELSKRAGDREIQQFYVRAATHKYEAQYSGGIRQSETLRDLSVDPREESDYSGSQPQVREQLAALLHEHLERFHAGEGVPLETAPPDEPNREVEDRLRALGYID